MYETRRRDGDWGEDACGSGVDGPHVPRQPAGEKDVDLGRGE